jgi:hypothetical protein
MTITIFNPVQTPSAVPMWVGKFPVASKIHLQVLTSDNTIRLAKYRDTLEHGDLGGQRVSYLDGDMEIEWQGDLWIHGISTNTGPSVIELED